MLVPVDINPVHVRTLQAIARSGSFSRAGETLHLSQPAISHHVRHLERAVGVPLLIRRGRRAAPTEAGAVLIDHAARAFRVLDDARETAAAIWPALPVTTTSSSSGCRERTRRRSDGNR